MDTIGKLHFKDMDRPPVTRRQRLEAEIAEAQFQLESEKKEKELLRQHTARLLERVNVLESSADDMLQAKRAFDSFTTTKRQHYAARTTPIPGEGLLTLSTLGKGNAPLALTPVPRRSTRRTAFTTTYSNAKILGPCEFVANWERQQRVDENIARKSALATATPGHSEGEGRPGVSMVRSSPAPSFLEKKEPAGARSLLPDLNEYKRRSTRRTRFYTNYDGVKIQMDPCDWPSHNGVLLVYP